MVCKDQACDYILTEDRWDGTVNVTLKMGDRSLFVQRDL